MISATPSSGRYSIVTSTGGQEPRQVDEKLARDDDGAVTLDLRGKRRAERELHVGGGELEQPFAGVQEHAGENLDGAAGGDDA